MQQSQTKKGLCFNCKNIIEIPITQCVTQCENCKETVIFLCHVIKPDNQPRIKIQCEVCHSFHTIMMCPKCKGYSAIRNFMSGFPYECPCQYRSTLVICNACFRLLSLPSNKNYEKTLIKCKACRNQFRYKICTYCRADIYKRGSDQSTVYLCPNPECPESQNNESKIQNPYNNPDLVNQRLSERVSLVENNKHQSEVDEKQLCKVCLDKEANMINVTCYHLSVCAECAVAIKGSCPICRAKGQYKKVFKS